MNEHMAIDSRHSYVADEEVGNILGQTYQCVCAACGSPDFITFGPQTRGNSVKQSRLVVNNKQPLGHLHIPPSPGLSIQDVTIVSAHGSEDHRRIAGF
jgi:hypothetical protein